MDRKDALTGTPEEAAERIENEAEIHVQEPQRAENPHMDVMLLAMSTFPGTLRATVFTGSDGKNGEIQVIGRSQLDPVPKYVAELLKREQECLDKIIILATEDTRKEKEITTPEGKTEIISPVEYFKNQIRGYLNPEGIEDREAFDSKRFLVVEAQESNPAEGIGEILRILRAETGAPLRLHMAMNGGLRGVQRILEAMIVLLKTENIMVSGAYSIEMGKNRIIDETERLKIFDFVSGMNEFYYDGRVNALSPYLKEDNSLVNAIKKVSEGIGWCNVREFEEGLQELGRFYRSNQTQNDPYLKLFRDTIKKDYEELLNPQISVLDEIKWCRKKGFYQQALTLLEARMSKTLIEKGVLIPSGKKYYTVKGQEITDNELFNGLIHVISKRKLSAVDFNRMTEKDYRNYLTFANRRGCEVNQAFHFSGYKVTAEKGSLKTSVDTPFTAKKHHALIRFLFLHKTLKDIRNKMNHADESFRYRKEQIDLALDFYIAWAEQLTGKE
ncbi:MAG: TM1812 family CRISPR-associated protein [Lachnospiraceae bacterium]|nr:TM1812 family CRISPR-associated protein [Lachnospiraceae bacterium]